MNKLLVIMFACIVFTLNCAAYASSIISIPVSNPVVSANSKIDIDLNPLINDVPYIVTCFLDSTSPTKLDMHFSPHLAPNGGFGVLKLDDKPVLKNTGTLQQGQNVLLFMASIAANNKTGLNALTVQNLDDHFSVSVKTCQAEPATHVTSAANKMAGGYFYVTNRLPYFLDITVGNFFTTDYCIYPYSRQYIYSSSGYEDIEIIGTHY